MGFFPLAKGIFRKQLLRRRAIRFQHVCVLGVLVGLVAAATDPPSVPLQATREYDPSPQDQFHRAAQLRLSALKSLCPKGVEILVWQVRPEYNEVRIAYSRKSFPEVTYAHSWEDVVLMIDRVSLPGLLVAKATVPMGVPVRGSGVGTWDRWIADSRVVVSIHDRSRIIEQGRLPRTAHRNAPTVSKYIPGGPNLAPVDAVSSR
jgi:hypothetical protein